jgi:hypothetical protein
LLSNIPGETGATEAGGAVAPGSGLFSASNPLAGVLPGSPFDTFVSAAIGADVPEFYVEHFDVPAFLLPIYQSASAAYGVPWEVLAAINQVETDFGTDLNVSSAGAVGWMQFMPSTWVQYGMDATGSDVADPYNAADAIFAAARYLAAAGASTDLPAAIFAYNHSTAYVQSVLLRAELLSGVPTTLVNSVSELSEGLFPIELRYHPKYKSVEQTAAKAGAGTTSASAKAGVAPAPSAVGAAVSDTSRQRRVPAAEIFASTHAAAVAVAQGTVVAIGHDHRLGTYVRLKDSFGNEYTYGNLASVAAYNLIPKPAKPSSTASLNTPSALASGPTPTAPATAGEQPTGGLGAVAAATLADGQLHDSVAISKAASPFAAFDFRPGVTADALIFGTTPHGSSSRSQAGLRPSQERSIIKRYFTSAFGLRRDQLEAKPLRVGSHVLAGAILGHLGATPGEAPHLLFELRPAGADQSLINPRPFLDAWTQLATLELHRKALGDPLYGPDLQSSDAGDTLKMSQIDLERIVLGDSHLHLALCERDAIAAGDVDRRVLASIEFLVQSGLNPTVGSGECPADPHGDANKDAAAGSDSIDITAINAVPVAGNQGTGTPTDAAIQALLTLPSANAPAQIASLETIPGAASTVADPSDADQIVLTFSPQSAPVALSTTANYTSGYALGPTRWEQLDAHLLAIPQPRVPTVVSTLAIRSAGSKPAAKKSKRG